MMMEVSYLCEVPFEPKNELIALCYTFVIV